MEQKKAISQDLAAELIAHIRGCSINKTEELLRQQLAAAEAKVAKLDLASKSQTTLSFVSSKKKEEVVLEQKVDNLQEGGHFLESIARPAEVNKILNTKAPTSTTPRMVLKWIAGLPISDAKKKSIDTLSKKLWAEFQTFEEIDQPCDLRAIAVDWGLHFDLASKMEHSLLLKTVIAAGVLVQ